jgi:quercetin dioxygenase-like cupin family protein
MVDRPRTRSRRPLIAPTLYFQLEVQLERLKQEPTWLTGSSNAITLAKGPLLRVVLTVIRKGGKLREHRIKGPLTLQVLSGLIRFTASGHVRDMGPGALVALEPALKHDVEALQESAFLLTLVPPS